jgi:hypothetical protein
MFYLFLAAHLVADFALQPLWLVRRKRYWDGLLIHTGLVLLCMLALPLIAVEAAALWLWMFVIAVVHFWADWWKIHCADGLIRSPFTGFVLDQVIHVGTLALVLSIALPPEVVWSLQGVTQAQPALLLSLLIIAALAVPIGLIVALDPHFRHAALAPFARLRAAVIALAVVGLTIYSGPWALPLALLSMKLQQRIAGQHPLDSLRGQFWVMLGGAVVGAMWLWIG